MGLVDEFDLREACGAQRIEDAVVFDGISRAQTR
jgi:hypothetical protein